MTPVDLIPLWSPNVVVLKVQHRWRRLLKFRHAVALSGSTETP